MLDQYINTISATDLFEGIDSTHIRQMFSCLQPRVEQFNKGNYIVLAGDQFERVGIILKGEAAVVKEDAAGNRVILTVIREGDMFGEILAFSNQSQWPFSVQVVQPCHVFFLSKIQVIGQCEKICPWHRTLIQNFLKIVSERAVSFSKQIEYLTIKSIRGKITAYLLELYKNTGNKNLILPLNRNELADFLNVSRPSMSREMCRMRDEGIIDFQRSSVKINDLEALTK